MAILKKDASDSSAELKKEINALKKEVAELKKALAKRPAAGKGADPRVDVLIEALTKNPGWSWAQTINEKF